MTDHTDSFRNLLAASRITSEAEHRHALPTWYALISSALFLLGIGTVTMGIFVGWFVPVLGVFFLSLNVASFPLLLAWWRARGIVPRAGRLASRRYWRTAPIMVPLALVLGFAALLTWPEQKGWFWLAIVVPFAIEHVQRLRAWTGR